MIGVIWQKQYDSSHRTSHTAEGHIAGVALDHSTRASFPMPDAAGKAAVAAGTATVAAGAAPVAAPVWYGSKSFTGLAAPCEQRSTLSALKYCEYKLTESTQSRHRQTKRP